jgi:hypothetical protein
MFIEVGLHERHDHWAWPCTGNMIYVCEGGVCLEWVREMHHVFFGGTTMQAHFDVLCKEGHWVTILCHAGDGYQGSSKIRDDECVGELDEDVFLLSGTEELDMHCSHEHRVYLSRIGKDNGDEGFLEVGDHTWVANHMI